MIAKSFCIYKWPIILSLRYRDGIYHMMWQGAGSEWQHAVSKDHVFWAPMSTALPAGAMSGGSVLLPDGDVVAIFKRIGQPAGHWAARPDDLSDPLLTNWSFTEPVNGIGGSDLAAGFLDGSGDGQYRIVADRHDWKPTYFLAQSEIQMFTSNLTSNLTQWQPQGNGTLHRYTWTRCVNLPAECGGHTYPCDPGMIPIPGTDVWVVYGMQKVCNFEGREFYALGKYDEVTHTFTLLDNTSDMGNNLFDGGAGYASMNVYDPTKKRQIWTQTLLEGDRPAGMPWTSERGWWGSLALPRVLELGNVSFDDGSRDYFLRTPPLPELAKLRKHNASVSSALAAGLRLRNGSTVQPLPLRAQSFEVYVTFALPDWSKAGWDVGVQMFWSDGDEEFTRVGIRDGSWMSGVDLWDEVNGDRSTLSAATATACRDACTHDSGCGAWTHTVPTLCRLKAQAQHSLQVVSGAPGCFLPSYNYSQPNASTSGLKQQAAIKFAQVYIDRSSSWITDKHCATHKTPGRDCGFGHFGYASTLRVIPSEDAGLRVHVFGDRSIVEVFGTDARAAVTARVYPTLSGSDRIGVYGSSKVLTVQAWELGSALTNTSAVLRGRVLKSDDASAPLPETGWFSEAGHGIFVHYLNGIQNACTDSGRCNSGGKNTSWSECVAEFDTEAFARDAHATGARYVIVTMMQATQYLLAPNAAYDNFTGYKPGEACAKRDLVLDLSASLSKQGLKLLLYWTGDGPRADPQAANGTGWAWPMPDMKPAPEFLRRWAAVLREYAVRYGERVSGWWIDGCHAWRGYDETNLRGYHDAIRAGNPKALIALNNMPQNPIDQPARNWSNGGEVSSWEDFTTGESNDFTDVPTSRWVTGTVVGADGTSRKVTVQWHALAFLGKTWAAPGVSITAAQLAAYTRKVQAVGGVISVDLQLFRNGSLNAEQVAMLSTAWNGSRSTVLKSDDDEMTMLCPKISASAWT